MTSNGSWQGSKMAMYRSVAKLAEERPSVLLTELAQLVDSVEWGDDRPDLFRCLILVTGVSLAETSTHVRGDGWRNLCDRGVYRSAIPDKVMTVYLDQVHEKVAARRNLGKIMNLLRESAGWDDLTSWCQEYALDVDEIVSMIRHAAVLARAVENG